MDNEYNIVWFDEPPTAENKKPITSLDVQKLQEVIQNIHPEYKDPEKTGLKRDDYNFDELKKALLFTGDLNGRISDFNRFIVEENDRTIPELVHIQLVLRFSNGFGASIIQGTLFNTGRKDLYEIGFMKDGNLIDLNGDAVRAFLTISQVKDYLIKLESIDNEGKNLKCLI